MGYLWGSDTINILLILSKILTILEERRRSLVSDNYSIYTTLALSHGKYYIPNDAMSTQIMLYDMLNVMATTATDCSDRVIYDIGTDMRCFKMTRAFLNRVGLPRCWIIPVMLDALCKQVIKNPGTHFDNSIFLLSNKTLNESSIRTALESIN